MLCYVNHKAHPSGVFKTIKMQSVFMQDLEQVSYWQEKRLMSSHWYNIYNPVISVELTELYDRVVGKQRCRKGNLIGSHGSSTPNPCLEREPFDVDE